MSDTENTKPMSRGNTRSDKPTIRLGVRPIKIGLRRGMLLRSGRLTVRR